MFGSKSFISLLISVGANPLREGDNGTPRTYADKAGRPDIISLLDESIKSASHKDNVVINGKSVALQLLLYYRKILREDLLLDGNRTRSRSRSRLVPMQPTMTRNHLLIHVIEINSCLAGPKHEFPETSWQGIIRFPGENSGEWNSEYCLIDDYKISPYRKELGVVSLHNVVSFRVYSERPTNFSILYYDDNIESTLHFAASIDLIPTILQRLVQITGKPIEFVDDKTLLSILESLEGEPKVRKRKKSPLAIKKQRTKSFNGVRILGSISSPGGSVTRRSISMDPGNLVQVLVNIKGHIICPIKFSAKLYPNIFSTTLHLKPDAATPGFILTSGNLSDILHYSILHSAVPQFDGHSDLQAFYMNYYRYCEPDQIISHLNKCWEAHKMQEWPDPYNSVNPEKRLFKFIEGFIRSPFVLTNFDQEIQFRDELATLFGCLVPNSFKEKYSVTVLQNIVHKVKQEKMKASISQLCDLNSLLGEGNSTEFCLTELDTEIVVAQIVCINADLYKQIQISEVLDLRYQKDKQFGVSLNKVHEFSNKIYRLVPTTILQSDDPVVQKATLKKWILIAEKLFQLRDYNSAIQLVNGITESSVMRLKHLSTSLSVKWIERFDKVKNAFDPQSNHANYRKLSVEAPCIPFVGVGTKDLLFTYEANPDYVDEGINFHKIRLIKEIIEQLKIEQPKQFDYSFLEFVPQVAQSLLKANPLTDDELYERSKVIEGIMKQREQKVDENLQLKKQIEKLQAEVALLKQQNAQKDELIKTLRNQRISSDPKYRQQHRRTSSHNILGDMDPVLNEIVQG